MDFSDLVKADLKSTHGIVGYPELRQPANLDRWRLELLTTKQAIEQQMSKRRATLQERHSECLRLENGRSEYLAVRAEYAVWKASANAIKRTAEARLIEIKKIRLALDGETPWSLLETAAQLLQDHPNAGSWRAAYQKLTEKIHV